MNAVHFSSATDLWATPQWLFDELNKTYCFNTDVCALPENAKCSHFYTPEMDGLKQHWRGVCWLNPPYGREIGKWVEKAHLHAVAGDAATVALLPARTDTRWFHDFIYRRYGIEFLKGRLRFGDSRNSAPFPSMIAVIGRTI